MWHPVLTVPISRIQQRPGNLLAQPPNTVHSCRWHTMAAARLRQHHTSFKTFVASVTVQIFKTDRKCPGCACAVLLLLAACLFNSAPFHMQPGHYCNINTGWKIQISSDDNTVVCRKTVIYTKKLHTQNRYLHKTVTYTKICPCATLSTTSHADWPGIETGDPKCESGDRQTA
jgi:hypothetical protein